MQEGNTKAIFKLAVAYYGQSGARFLTEMRFRGVLRDRIVLTRASNLMTCLNMTCLNSSVPPLGTRDKNRAEVVFECFEPLTEPAIKQGPEVFERQPDDNACATQTGKNDVIASLPRWKQRMTANSYALV